MGWLARVRQASEQAPRLPRQPLHLGGACIGSLEEALARRLLAHGLERGRAVLREHAGAWHVDGPTHAGLDALALALRELGLAGAWRNEKLAVHDAKGVRVGRIERAAVRPLGIATFAVHLVGQTPDGRVWVQQRALDKANDPGLWDTLMGGMIGAGDTLHGALARETLEEAGLALDLLRELQPGGVVQMRRPTAEAGGAGYLIERIDWFRAVVPFGLAPVNLDGEVEQFELLARDELLQRLERGEFTPEATLILAAALSLGG